MVTVLADKLIESFFRLQNLLWEAMAQDVHRRSSISVSGAYSLILFPLPFSAEGAKAYENLGCWRRRGFFDCLG